MLLPAVAADCFCSLLINGSFPCCLIPHTKTTHKKDKPNKLLHRNKNQMTNFSFKYTIIWRKGNTQTFFAFPYTHTDDTQTHTACKNAVI